LGDEEVFGIDHRHGRVAQIHGPCAIEELVLQSRPCQHDIEGHPRRAMDERHHAGPPHEVRIGDAHKESCRFHGAREFLGIIGCQCERHIDIGAQPRKAVRDDRLRPEDVPPAPLIEDR
jgi:hypothetical protein